jgi:hypothetical protein
VVESSKTVFEIFWLGCVERETKVLKFRWVDGGSVEVTEMAKLTSLKGLFDVSRQSSKEA